MKRLIGRESQRRSGILFLSCLCVASAALLGPALAAQHALLVGASGYAEEIPPLEGPPNDVAYIYQALRQRGFPDAHIRVLLDRAPEGSGLVAHGPASRAMILSELDALSARAEPDDFVLVFLSGHGSQQPGAQDVTEGDGLDELFLPSDAGGWSDSSKAIENAVIDDELGRKVDAIRRRGAFVWIIVDSCHSGTMTRGVRDDSMRVKQITPQRLGVPAELLSRATRAAQTRQDSDSDGSAFLDGIEREASSGGLVAFFAAQANQPAIETRASRISPDGAWRSLFSTVLGQKLMQGSAVTYRDLAHQVLAGYDTYGSDAPSPLFEGDLDRPLFGAAGAATTRLPVTITEDDRLQLAAGRLHGLAEGSTIALYPLDGAEDSPIAMARLAARGLVESELALIDGDVEDLPFRMMAEIAAKPISLTLRVARPYAPASPAAERVRDAVARLADEAQAAGGAQWDFVAPDAEADVYLRVAKDRIWYLPASGTWRRDGRDRSFSEPVGASVDAVAADLGNRLRRLATGHNLVRISHDVPGNRGARALEIKTYVLRDPTPPHRRAASGPPDAYACSARPPLILPPAAEPIDLAVSPAIYHCDTIYLELVNRTDRPTDVTLLFLDSVGELQSVPLREARVHPHGRLPVMPLQIATWDWSAGAPSTIGIERIIVIAVARRPGDDLSFVADFGYLAGSGRTRGFPVGAFGSLQTLLEAAALQGGRTRSAGAAAASNMEQASMQVIRWETSLRRGGP